MKDGISSDENTFSYCSSVISKSESISVSDIFSVFFLDPVFERETVTASKASAENEPS